MKGINIRKKVLTKEEAEAYIKEGTHELKYITDTYGSGGNGLDEIREAYLVPKGEELIFDKNGESLNGYPVPKMNTIYKIA